MQLQRGLHDPHLLPPHDGDVLHLHQGRAGALGQSGHWGDLPGSDREHQVQEKSEFQTKTTIYSDLIKLAITSPRLQVAKRKLSPEEIIKYSHSDSVGS